MGGTNPGRKLSVRILFLDRIYRIDRIGRGHRSPDEPPGMLIPCVVFCTGKIRADWCNSWASLSAQSAKILLIPSESSLAAAMLLQEICGQIHL